MYKSIFRAYFRGSWLLVGIRRSGMPFAYYEQDFDQVLCFREYTLRLFWFEFILTKLPY